MYKQYFYGAIMRVFTVSNESNFKIPLFSDSCACGFPSPAADFVEQELDLTQYCIKHPSASYYIRAEGESMILAGISSGDLLVVDRAETARHGDVVVAAIDGEFTVKRLCTHPRLALEPMNPAYATMFVNPDSLEIFGVVTYVIHSTRG